MLNVIYILEMSKELNTNFDVLDFICTYPMKDPKYYGVKRSKDTAKLSVFRQMHLTSLRSLSLDQQN